MAADGQIKIDAKIDTSDVDKGLDELKNKLLNAATGANKLDKSLDKVEDTAEDVAEATERATDATNKVTEATEKAAKTSKKAAEEQKGFIEQIKDGIDAHGKEVAAITALIGVLKKELEVIRETSNAYKIQENAERGLAQAAKNNPYISADNVENLKNYASELQSFSNIGDETAINLMSNLVAAGRTEEQIKKIFLAAANASANGAISFDSAVENLNNTLNGEAGEIADLVPAIHNLTEEQLQNGDAVDLVNEKFEGMAETLADAQVQAQNAKGDFKEAIGALTAPAASAWDNFWKSFYEKGTAFINRINDRLELLSKDNKQLLKDLDVEAYKYNAAGESGLTIQNTEALAQGKRLLETKERTKKITADEKQLLIYINKELRKRQDAEKYSLEEEQKILDAQKDQTEQINAQKKAVEEKIDAERQWHNEVDNYSLSSNKALDDQIKTMERRAELTDTEVSAQEKYNTILNSYLALVQEIGFANEFDTKATGVVQRREMLQKAAEELKKYNEELEKQKAAEEAARKAAEEKAKAEEEARKKRAAAEAEAPELLEQVRNLRKDEAEEFADQQQELLDLIKKINENEVLSEAEKAAAIEEINATIEENEKNRAQRIADEKKAAQDKALADAEAMLQAVADLRTTDDENFKKEQQALSDFAQQINDNEVLSEEQKAAAIEEINATIEENEKARDERIAQAKKEKQLQQLEDLKNFSTQLLDISKDAADLSLEYSQLKNENELANLDKKYKAGELGEEQYNEKKRQIQKKAAQDEYRANMASWTMTLAQATANIAEGITKALAAPFPANIANGAIVSAAGAVQLASIIGSKPVPPAFANGGIVGGTSYHGDNINARVNSGEMVLTMAQQRALFDVANGSGAMGAPNITVNNSAANLVDVTPSISANNINLMIDARVKDSLQNGAYNESLTIAQQGSNGTFYGI